MRRTPTGLLLVVVVATFLAAPSLTAQVAPTIQGETGLFQLVDAETLAPGRFSLGLSYSRWARTAAPSLVVAPQADDPLRYSLGRAGLSLAYGVGVGWELSLTSGQMAYDSQNRRWAGSINGHERSGKVDRSETDKVRIGSKYVFPSKDPVKVAIFGGLAIPTQSKSTPAALSTYRADYDFGLSLNYSWVTFQASYLLAGDLGNDFDVSNQFTWGLGANIPIIPNVLRGIAEVTRVHYDGGASKPEDFFETTLGARFAIANTGLVASGGLRANIDRWVKHGSNPTNLGGILQLAYAPSEAARPATRVIPATSGDTPSQPAPVDSAPAAESTPPPAAPASTTGDDRTPAPAPAPVAPPAPKTETTTTDEILFDAAKSRLTNIAKAILDGVALRLKNNLAATCTVAAHTDPQEKGGDHTALAKARAEAAKDYLVKRHGIDASRVKVDAKGDADPTTDATRNRRAVVTVTFP